MSCVSTTYNLAIAIIYHYGPVPLNLSRNYLSIATIRVYKHILKVVHKVVNTTSLQGPSSAVKRTVWTGMEHVAVAGVGVGRGGGGGVVALNILTGMCEYGVLKQTHIEGVR